MLRWRLHQLQSENVGELLWLAKWQPLGIAPQWVTGPVTSRKCVSVCVSPCRASKWHGTLQGERDKESVCKTIACCCNDDNWQRRQERSQIIIRKLQSPNNGAQWGKIGSNAEQRDPKWAISMQNRWVGRQQSVSKTIGCLPNDQFCGLQWATSRMLISVLPACQCASHCATFSRLQPSLHWPIQRGNLPRRLIALFHLLKPNHCVCSFPECTL